MYDDEREIFIRLTDDEDDEDGQVRNAVIVGRRGGGDRDHRGPSRRPRPLPVRVSQSVAPAPVPAESTDSKKTLSDWVPDALRGLAAVMPLPVPPTAESDVAANVANMITYLGAVAAVAQRKEQLHTLAAIAERHL